MDNNSLLVIILAFMLGCMCSGMMKQMCGPLLVEGSSGHIIPCRWEFFNIHGCVET